MDIDECQSSPCRHGKLSQLYLDKKGVKPREEIKCLTNRFYYAVRLFSNRSQMTSKCCKNKEVAAASVSLMFLSYFDVLCDLLLNRTHGNRESICFIE